MPVIDTPIKEGVQNTRMKIARGTYDFAIDGGAISTIPLMGGTLLPNGITVVGGFIEVHTQLTSGGAATIAVQVEAANDVIPAIAVASFTAGRKVIVPEMDSGNTLAAAKDIRTTAARDISAVIAAFALTAGKFSVVLYYIDPLA